VWGVGFQLVCSAELKQRLPQGAGLMACGVLGWVAVIVGGDLVSNRNFRQKGNALNSAGPARCRAMSA